MNCNWFKNVLLSVVIVAPMVINTSCGTILYPERRDQKHGNIDPGVVVLDAVGLLFFLIPGVIAFAVDFTTGAIYLPEGDEPFYIKDKSSMLDGMKMYQVPKEELSQEFIISFIKEKTGHEIDANNLQATNLRY